MQFINTLELAVLRGAVPGSQRELAAEVVEVNKEFAQAYKLLAAKRRFQNVN
jgi:hypothetical protein